MKKAHYLALAGLAMMSVGALSGCGSKSAADVTVGLICLHGDYSTYDKNFIDAMKAAQKNLGFKLVIKEDVPESTECYNTANSLVEQGCNIIFADSFGHEAHMIKAAKEHSNVLFCHATGTNGANENLDNFGDAFASIYEGRYLAGVAAGLKLKALYGENPTAEQAKLGYVGAFTYAEVMSGYTSWFLGVRSIVPNATMEVKFTSSWYDENAEKTIALELIERGAKLISQHADSHGAPSACESKGIPNVSYNGSTLEDGPNTYLINSRINWQPYYEHVINNFKKAKDEGKKATVENDFTGTLKDNSVVVSEASKNCPEGTQAKLDEVKAKLEAGTLHVFDASKFTIKGAAPTEATVKPGSATWANPGSVEFLKDGYYHESEFRSAPSFDIEIDGITLLNRAYGD